MRRERERDDPMMWEWVREGEREIGDSPRRRIDRDAPKCLDVAAESERCLKVGEARPIYKPEKNSEIRREGCRSTLVNNPTFRSFSLSLSCAFPTSEVLFFSFVLPGRKDANFRSLSLSPSFPMGCDSVHRRNFQSYCVPLLRVRIICAEEKHVQERDDFEDHKIIKMSIYSNLYKRWPLISL